MNWKKIPLGLLQTNCYLLYNEDKECIIFDPGAEGEKLIAWLEQNELKPIAILLTHAHFDHIGAVDQVRDHFGIKVYIHELEADWLTDATLNGSVRYEMEPIQGKPADELLTGEGMLEVGPFTLQLFETPGHSPGSLSYYVKEVNAVFSGDALFSGGIGRTDLPGGDQDVLIESISSRLLTLPDDTTALPGHGLSITVSETKVNNPFFNGML